jgi:hypothetical protein
MTTARMDAITATPLRCKYLAPATASAPLPKSMRKVATKPVASQHAPGIAGAHGPAALAAMSVARSGNAPSSSRL